MKEMREYRHQSQEDFAAILGVSKQAYGKKERGESDGFSPDDFEKLLEKMEIDARWLFGQIQGPIEASDFRITGGKSDAAEMKEFLNEYRDFKKTLSTNDYVCERIKTDPELRECVELLIKNRVEVGRVMGYIERGEEERNRNRDTRESAG